MISEEMCQSSMLVKSILLLIPNRDVVSEETAGVQNLKFHISAVKIISLRL